MSLETPKTGGLADSRLTASENDATQVLRRKKGQQSSSANANPEVQKTASGEHLFGFHLRQEIGHGGFARVYLAEQADLADRPVVLKVSRRDGQEPQLLAQLQHTHIVPIYSVHEDPARELRAVCMPYFGGANLLVVLRHLWSRHQQPLHGSQLADSLRAVSGPPVVSKRSAVMEREGKNGVPRVIPWEGEDYVRAVVWLTARLAEALQHAHERGVLHSDIKPSNILLTADGQPMLLDFNVAQEFDPGRDPAISCLGGTMIYMAPEHLRALGAQSAVGGVVVPLGQPIDHRSDLYSLGVVLYELLVGGMPFTGSQSSAPVTTVLMTMAEERTRWVPSAKRKRGDVPWGLESVLRKCLEPDPANRYQRGEHFAEDLRRLLEDRPLRYAKEKSWRERAAKWARRHPRLVSSAWVALVALAILSVVGGTLMSVRQHLARTQGELQEAQADDRRRDFEEAALRALCLIHTVSDAHNHLQAGVAVCEQALGLYGVLEEDDWQSRAGWERVSETERTRLAETTRELLVLLAAGRVRESPGRAEVVRESLGLLDRADRVAGLMPSRAVWEERARFYRLLGDEKQWAEARREADRIEPASAQDYYLLALSHSRSGRIRDGIASLTQALQRQPRHYWALLQRGICYQELGQWNLAAADFGTCVGLWPEFAWGSFNRGWVLDQSGNKAEAVRDYTAALAADPELVPAYFNRGMALVEGRRFAEARSDFGEALRRGRNDAAVHLGLGMALEGLKRHPEADEAFAEARRRARQSKPEVQVRVGWVFGFAIWERRPEAAAQAFAEVLRLVPEQPQALYGQAMIQASRGDNSAALALFHRAIAVQPSFVEARRFRGVLLARLGRFKEATEDINWCLEADRESGATHYAAACVASLYRAKQQVIKDAAEAEAQVFGFLQEAFSRGYGMDRARTDPDLSAVVAHGRLASLLVAYPAKKP